MILMIEAITIRNEGSCNLETVLGLPILRVGALFLTSVMWEFLYSTGVIPQQLSGVIIES